MAEQANEIDKDQQALTLEQAGDVSQEPKFVSEEQFQQVQRRYESLVEGLKNQLVGVQSSIDKRVAEAESKAHDRIREAQTVEGRISAIQQDVQQGSVTASVGESLIASERARLNQPANNTPVQPEPAPITNQTDNAKALLEGWGVDPNTPGIDYSQDLLTNEGQGAFMKSAFAAHKQAIETYERQKAQTPQPQSNETVNPPVVNSGTSNNQVTNMNDNYEAYISKQITKEQFEVNKRTLQR